MAENIKILVVEDSKIQAKQLKHVLEQNHYDVSVAYNGHEALQSIKTKPPIIVISDILMPGMDGYELCRRIKQDQNLKCIHVILLTSLTDPSDIIKGLECGADNFITKPYNELFLLSRLKYILANQELRQNVFTSSEIGIEIFFAGQKHHLNSERMQIIDLLLSTYETLVEKNKELTDANVNLRLMQKELEKKNIQLEKLNAQKDKFLGTAVHDLRNPLGVINSYSQFILDTMDADDDRRELISSIKSTSEFMQQLVNDLLTISAFEIGTLNLKLQYIDLVAFVKYNVSLNQILAEKKGIQLIFESEENLPEIEVDVTKLEQVLNNLISNAIKFSYSDSQVMVNVYQEEDQLILKVADEGQGIPKEDQQKLFKPFQDISVKSTGGERSTRLGLLIVREIVEGHGGRIWVESQVGKGATFYVSLPINCEISS